MICVIISGFIVVSPQFVVKGGQVQLSSCYEPIAVPSNDVLSRLRLGCPFVSANAKSELKLDPTIRFGKKEIFWKRGSLSEKHRAREPQNLIHDFSRESAHENAHGSVHEDIHGNAH